ncbi:MAG: TIGR00282 family metallophosphoesterase [Candidatus Omnitrophica bacterium]|nr:TIGR00282 family metallophosphoesterase [Candidatus Omnitrophota bacterium]
MKILMIGDIVGKPGRDAIKHMLSGLIEKSNIDFVVANGENAAGGSGLTPVICDELFSYGIDVLTSGDHIWKKRDIYDYMDMSSSVLRPLNYPDNNPGKGYTVKQTKKGVSVGVINIIGRVFMNPADNPFEKILEVIKELSGSVKVIVVDFHAEATSEKIAMGYFLDGKVSAIIGTHTHVQTADETILEQQTAYITDIGMTGPFSGVIGRNKNAILERFITQMPTRFEMAENDVRINGVLIDVDEKTGKARTIERINKKL